MYDFYVPYLANQVANNTDNNTVVWTVSYIRFSAYVNKSNVIVNDLTITIAAL